MTLGLDIEGMALEIVSLPSPSNRRQTVRKVNANSSKGSMEMPAVAPSFNNQMFKIPLALSTQQQSSNTTLKGGNNSVKNNINKQQQAQKGPTT